MNKNKLIINIFSISVLLVLSFFIPVKSYSLNINLMNDTGLLINNSNNLNILKKQYELNNEFLKTQNYADLPASFDLRIDRPSWTDGIRDQKPYPTCWAFATTAGLESNLGRQGVFKLTPGDENHFLSPSHLSHAVYNDMANDNGGEFPKGGNNGIAIDALSKWYGPKKESTYPYKDILKTLTDSQINDADYHLQNAIELPSIYHSQTPGALPTTDLNIVDEVKNSIQKYGAGALGYKHPCHLTNGDTTEVCYDSYSQTDSSIYNSKTDSPTHAVAVIGWDDNFSKYSFTDTPEGNGAFLIKDSWGWPHNNDFLTTHTDAGYYWLSYYDKSLMKESIAFYNLENKYNYDKVHFLDNTRTNLSEFKHFSVSDNLTSYNTFTSGKKPELLKAVSYKSEFPSTNNYKYSAQIYTNIPKNIPTSSDLLKTFGKPTQIIPVNNQTAGEFAQYPGFHTVKLNQPIKLNPGTRYAVGIKISVELETNVFPIDYESHWSINPKDNFHFAPNESFVSFDNKTLSDWTQYADKVIIGGVTLSEDGNFSIKSYTNFYSDTNLPNNPPNTKKIPKFKKIKQVGKYLKIYFKKGNVNQKIKIKYKKKVFHFTLKSGQTLYKIKIKTLNKKLKLHLKKHKKIKKKIKIYVENKIYKRNIKILFK